VAISANFLNIITILRCFIIKSNSLLSIANLHKDYGTIKAVDGLSFTIFEGEIYGLLGPNGAGKSTTIKSILGLLSIQQGEISVFGLNPLIEPEKVKEKIGYVAESSEYLYDSMTVRELINFVASIRKLDSMRTAYLAQQYLQSFGVIEHYNSLVGSLSKGTKQKIQIILSLLHEPRLLILDEPLSGLDAKSASIFKEILQIHVRNGGAIMLSTHIMEQAQNLCTRIGIINHGRMVAEGTFEELQQMTQSAGETTLENLFLKLTNQDESVNAIVNNLKNLSRK